MNAVIRQIRPESEYFIEEGCHIIELLQADDDRQLSIARARVEPGRTTRWHRLLGTAERYVILEGEGLVEIDDLSSRQVRPGDVVLIPPACRQRITNSGRGDLLFLAICTPPFQPENYEDIERLIGPERNPRRKP